MFIQIPCVSCNFECESVLCGKICCNFVCIVFLKRRLTVVRFRAPGGKHRSPRWMKWRVCPIVIQLGYESLLQCSANLKSVFYYKWIMIKPEQTNSYRLSYQLFSDCNSQLMNMVHSWSRYEHTRGIINDNLYHYLTCFGLPYLEKLVKPLMHFMAIQAVARPVVKPFRVQTALSHTCDTGAR